MGRVRVFGALAVITSLFLLAFSVITFPAAHAVNPQTMSFQGKVVKADGTNMADGTYGFVFKLYSVSSAGTALWTETQSSVTVAAGTFQVNLGSSCSFFVAATCNNNTPIDFSVSNSLYLGITFNGDAAGEMTPRVQLQSVPYAFNADKVGGLSASQFVQLSPSAQQTGAINVSGGITSAGALQGNSLSINSGALAVSSTGAITAATGIATTGQVSIQSASYISNQLLLNNGQITAPPAYPNGYAPSLVVVTSQAAGSRPLFFGYNDGTGSYSSYLTSGACGSFSSICLDLGGAGTGTTAAAPLTALQNSGTTLKVGGGSDGNFTNLALLPGNGTTTIGTTTTINASGEIIGKGYDYFNPSLLTGATTTVGSGGSAGGNFGGVFSSGAFIGTTDQYSQEFVASLAAATTNNRNVGDDNHWYFVNGGGNTVSSSDISTLGGYFRMTTGTTANRGAFLGLGATAGTLDKPINLANLPIIQMKVRPSIVRATDDFFWGATDTAVAPTTNDTLPTNGIFFASNNSTGVTGWTGIVRSAGATIGTPVTCPGTISTNFATGRIVVVDATTVRFFIDSDATDGVNLIDCGTVTGALPTVDIAPEMHVIHTINTTSNFDMDYYRYWQDDNVTSATNVPSIVTAQQAQADLSTDTTAGSVTDSLAVPTSTAAVVSPEASAESISSPTSAPASKIPVTQPKTSNSSRVAVTDQGLTITNATGKTVASIDNSGNATLTGNLNIETANLSGGLSVAGDANFGGLTTFQKLATFVGKTIFRQDVSFQGHLAVSSDSAGYAQFKAGETKLHVTFKKEYDSAPIISLTANDGSFTASTIDQVTTKGFDIVLQQPATAAMKLSWLALGANEPLTTTNPIVTVPKTSVTDVKH